jgi:hypothetical protein
VAQCEVTFPLLVSCKSTRRTFHALCTFDMSSRSAQRIGRFLSVSWIHTHSGCEFVFPNDFDTILFMVPAGKGVIKPSGNGLYMLPHEHAPHPSPQRIGRLVTFLVSPSLPIATQYCGTAGSDTSTCKAFRLSIPTVSRLPLRYLVN